MCTIKSISLKVPVINWIFLALLWPGFLLAEDDKTLAGYKPVLSDSFKQALKNADIEAGAKYFDRKCAQCHDNAESGQHNMGPLLWNWFDRQAAVMEGFDYSEAMKASGHTWNFATLNYYLENTKRAVPGRIMNFRGIKSEKQRANLLAYLAAFNKNPPELPE